MSRDATRIEGKAVLVTGANRGIGQTPVAGLYEDLSGRAALERSLTVNLFGPHDLTHAFPPALTESRGTVFDVVSLATWAAVPALPAYSVSKAALFSLSQAQRVLWAGRRVSLHAAILGPVETDMIRDLEIPKFSRSPSPTASSTAWRPRRRRSSRIRCQRRWRRAGVAVRPRSSSARTPLSSRHRRTRHRQRTRVQPRKTYRSSRRSFHSLRERAQGRLEAAPVPTAD